MLSEVGPETKCMVPVGFSRRVNQLVAIKTTKYCGKEIRLCYS